MIFIYTAYEQLVCMHYCPNVYLNEGKHKISGILVWPHLSKHNLLYSEGLFIPVWIVHKLSVIWLFFITGEQKGRKGVKIYSRFHRKFSSRNQGVKRYLDFFCKFSYFKGRNIPCIYIKEQIWTYSLLLCQQ